MPPPPLHDPAWPNRIRAVRLARGVTLQDLAARVDTSHQQIGRLERGERRLTQDWLQRLGDALGVRPADLLPAEQTGPPPAPPLATRPPANVDPHRVEVFDDRASWSLPIYASAEGGPNGMVTHFEVVEHAPMPSPLVGVHGAFGMYVVGDSMEPAYRQGDRILCHPSQPPRAGDDVLVVLATEDNTQSCLVKRYVRGDRDAIVLEQFNPPRSDIVLPRRDIRSIHLVVGRYNRL